MPSSASTKRYENKTEYPDREVGSIVRWVLKYLEVEDKKCFVKVRYLRDGWGCYAGRFYPHAHHQRGMVYNHDWNEWREVGPVIPKAFDHLIVCRIRRPGAYPMETHVYDRKDSPGTWIVENWQEALVSIMAHEAYHLRQHTVRNAGHGRRHGFSEVDTEWAAYRLWKEWRETHPV